MIKKYVLFIITLMFLATFYGFAQFNESGEMVVMETEHYTVKIAGSGSYSSHSWATNNSESDSSGGECMEATPNNGTYALGSPDAPCLEFAMNISNSGTYYV